MEDLEVWMQKSLNLRCAPPKAAVLGYPDTLHLQALGEVPVNDSECTLVRPQPAPRAGMLNPTHNTKGTNSVKNIYLQVQVSDDSEAAGLLEEVAEIDGVVEAYEMVQDTACVLVSGNPFDGMSVFGPFTDGEEAIEFADGNTPEGGGITVLLGLPE